MKSRILTCIIIVLFLIPSLSLAQDKVDEISTKQIKEYTTKPEFLSPLVDYIPESATVPSPRDFLGYVAGTPKKLTYARDIHRYLYELAHHSGRIKVFETGKSNEGRSRVLAVIADNHTLSNIETYKEYMKKLSDPRGISENEAQKIIKAAKPVYLITGGLHSPETGSPDMLMELAYRLIVSDKPEFKSIRENIITLIVPVLEVDGREKLVDWYYRYTVDATDWEDKPPSSPPYWGKYTLHDNNREGIQISQPLTQQLYDVFFEYHPVIGLDLHESIPLLYISMGTGPYNPNMDPIAQTEFQLIANYELSTLTKYGMPGVWTWGFYTGWYPGYLLWITANHNAVGRFYETFGNAGATTFERKIQGSFAGKDVTTRQWFRPIPPPKKVMWSFRNNINYMQSGVISGLYFTSQNDKMFLENFWEKGCKAIAKGKEEAPYAWIITCNEKKKDMTGFLIKQLMKHGVEISQLEEEFTYNGKEYFEGTYIVRLDQPYGPLAKNLLEIQKFPADADYTPYDDVAWTLGLQYGVETVKVDSISILNKRMSTVTSPVHIKSDIAKDYNPNYYIVPNYGSPSLISLRYEIKDYDVYAVETCFTVGKDSIPAGSWIIPVSNLIPSRKETVKKAAEKFSIDLLATDSKPDVSMHKLDLPRIGVYHNWVYTQDTGWFRFTIEKYGIPYTLISDDDVREGNLLDKFDMIIIPELGSFITPKILIHGQDDKYGPMPYTKTPEFPSHGTIDSSEDITRGMGFEGLKNLEDFITDGGLLVTLGGGSILPVELGLVSPANRINPAASKIFNPGSFVKMRVLDKTSPITYGYEEFTHIFTGNSPLFDVSFKDRKYIVMQYGLSKAKEYASEEKNTENIKDGDICISGLIKNQQQLIHKPAILNIPRKLGRVVIFNFNPCHRFLNHHDFGLVFNTILNWNDLSNNR